MDTNPTSIASTPSSDPTKDPIARTPNYMTREDASQMIGESENRLIDLNGQLAEAVQGLIGELKKPKPFVPSVGRIVTFQGPEPVAAVIVKVHNEQCVSLRTIANGPGHDDQYLPSVIKHVGSLPIARGHWAPNV